MHTLSSEDIEWICGGNANDTVNGTFVEGGSSAASSGPSSSGDGSSQRGFRFCSPAGTPVVGMLCVTLYY